MNLYRNCKELHQNPTGSRQNHPCSLRLGGNIGPPTPTSGHWITVGVVGCRVLRSVALQRPSVPLGRQDKRSIATRWEWSYGTPIHGRK